MQTDMRPEFLHNVTAKSLSIIIRIWKIPDSNLQMRTKYPYNQASQILGQHLQLVHNCADPHISSSLFIARPLTLRYKV
jgi:hypothetical protein